MNIIAMIPMRLGSARIPKKNIRYMLDKPLMQYPIELALGCGRFDGVWVNTECEGLKPYAEALGASFHRRPNELASDTATNRDFTYEFLLGHPCDYLVMLNTTSPLLRPKTLEAFIGVVEGGGYDTVVSVVSERTEAFFEGAPLNFTLDKKVNSQCILPVEKIVWALTAWRRETFLRSQERGENPVFGGRLGRFTIPKDESCDLDTPEDWNIAEGVLLSRRRISEARYLQL